MSDLPILHGFFRSSASYRVRICLNLKGISFAQNNRKLRLGEQRAPDFLALNPQALVPAFEVDGKVLTQSLAICEYLDERHPDPPLLPQDAVGRAHVRALAQLIACDIHPVQNLKILQRVEQLGGARAAEEWAAEVTEEGLEAYEALHRRHGGGAFSYGDRITLADLCLVPQIFNARRFGAKVPPLLAAIEARCLELDAFARAAPGNQPDAV